MVPKRHRTGPKVIPKKGPMVLRNARKIIISIVIDFFHFWGPAPYPRLRAGDRAAAGEEDIVQYTYCICSVERGVGGGGGRNKCLKKLGRGEEGLGDTPCG